MNRSYVIVILVLALVLGFVLIVIKTGVGLISPPEISMVVPPKDSSVVPPKDSVISELLKSPEAYVEVEPGIGVLDYAHGGKALTAYGKELLLTPQVDLTPDQKRKNEEEFEAEAKKVMASYLAQLGIDYDTFLKKSGSESMEEHIERFKNPLDRITAEELVHMCKRRQLTHHEFVYRLGVLRDSAHKEGTWVPKRKK